jgi:hypothetical protein
VVEVLKVKEQLELELELFLVVAVVPPHRPLLLLRALKRHCCLQNLLKGSLASSYD